MPTFLTGSHCSRSCSQHPGVAAPLLLQGSLLLACLGGLYPYMPPLCRHYMGFEVEIGGNSYRVIVISVSPVQKCLCPSKATLQKANAHLGRMTRIQTVVLSYCHVALAGTLSCVFLTGNEHTIFLEVVWFVSARHKAWRQQWTKCLLFLFSCVSPLLCFAPYLPSSEKGKSLIITIYHRLFSCCLGLNKKVTDYKKHCKLLALTYSLGKTNKQTSKPGVSAFLFTKVE